MDSENDQQGITPGLIIKARRKPPGTRNPSPSVAPYAVSLTSFLDFFTAKTVSQGLTVVRKAVKELRTDYSPQFDLYREVRETIRASGGKRITMDLSLASPNKAKHYPELIEGWNKFIGRKSFETTLVKRKEWAHDGLIVRVNPEVALVRDDSVTYTKLYFKTAQPSKAQVEVIYQLMHEMLVDEPHEQVGVLDVRRGKLVASPKVMPDRELATALRVEATRFRLYLEQHLK